MNNHWPVLASILIVLAAASFGLYRHSQLAEAAAPRPQDRPVFIQKAKPPVKTVERAEAPVDGTVAPVAAAPVETKVAPTTTGGLIPSFASAITSNFKSMDARRADLVNNLKAALQTKLNIVPTDTPNGGFELTADGAHLEMYPMPDWHITIYNFTIGQKTESPGFKQLYDGVVDGLKLTIIKDYQDNGDGKLTARADSLAGRLVITKDTSKSLSMEIKPLMRKPTSVVSPMMQNPGMQQGGALPQTGTMPPRVARPGMNGGTAVQPAANNPLPTVKPATPPKPPKPPATETNDDKF